MTSLVSTAPWINSLSQQEYLYKIVQTYLESMYKEAIQDPSNVFTISGRTNLDREGGQGVRGDEERKSKWLCSTIWCIKLTAVFLAVY